MKASEILLVVGCAGAQGCHILLPLPHVAGVNVRKSGWFAGYGYGYGVGYANGIGVGYGVGYEDGDGDGEPDSNKVYATVLEILQTVALHVST